MTNYNIRLQNYCSGVWNDHIGHLYVHMQKMCKVVKHTSFYNVTAVCHAY